MSINMDQQVAARDFVCNGQRPSLYTAMRLAQLLRDFRDRLKVRMKHKPTSKKVASERELAKFKIVANAYVARSPDRSPRKPPNDAEVASVISYLQLSKAQSSNSLEVTARDDHKFLKFDVQRLIQYWKIDQARTALDNTTVFLHYLQDVQTNPVTRLQAAARHGFCDSLDFEKYLANIEHLMLCIQQAALDLLVRSSLEALNSDIYHWNKWFEQLQSKSEDWFSEWSSGRPPLSSTMPWNIKPSLLVLWGVCWMFYMQPVPATSSSQGEAVAAIQDNPWVLLETGGTSWVSQTNVSRDTPAQAMVSAYPLSSSAVEDIPSTSHVEQHQHLHNQHILHNQHSLPFFSLDKHTQSHNYNNNNLALQQQQLQLQQQDAASPTLLSTPIRQYHELGNNAGLFNMTGQNRRMTQKSPGVPSHGLGLAHSLSDQVLNTNISQATQQRQRRQDVQKQIAITNPGNSIGIRTPLTSSSISPNFTALGSTAFTTPVRAWSPVPNQSQQSYLNDHAGWAAPPVFNNDSSSRNTYTSAISVPPYAEATINTSTSSPSYYPSAQYGSLQQNLFSQEYSPNLQMPSMQGYPMSPHSVASERGASLAPALSIQPSPLNPLKQSPVLDDDQGSQRESVESDEPPRNALGQLTCNHEKCVKKALVFQRRSDWKRHNDTHTRPYKCTHGCNKAFTWPGGLRRHEAEVHWLHGGPKGASYCPVPNCKRASGKIIGRKENLKEHMRREHPEYGKDLEDNQANQSEPSELPILNENQTSTGPSQSRKRRRDAISEASDQTEPLTPDRNISSLMQIVTDLRMENKRLRTELSMRDDQISQLQNMILGRYNSPSGLVQ